MKKDPRVIPATNEHRARAVRDEPRPRWRLSAAALIALLAFVVGAAVLATAARADSKADMRSLDEQVQEVKSDVLGIAEELSRLEEKLLYPSGTQVSVFVSLTDVESFRLDAMRILIDGKPVAHHIYSFNELEALEKGGVQRIYTGNVRAGEHRLGVSIIGKRSGEDFARDESFTFTKEVEPKLIGVEVSGAEAGGSIRIGGW